MFIVECYLIAFMILALLAVLGVGIYNGFPWKWLNILCQVILIVFIVFILISFVALCVGTVLKGGTL